ncbi:MAG: 30S ribosomal protein S6 [Patescibacteria group bacterium]|jgi:small subunit ribosomal protein S6
MAKYELTFVFDKKNKELPKRLEDFIKSAKAKVIKEEDWGVKSLAYPINKLEEAKYLYFKVEAEPKTIKELEEKIRLEEDLLRSLVVRV